MNLMAVARSAISKARRTLSDPGDQIASESTVASARSCAAALAAV
jgi:hypothetical protein